MIINLPTWISILLLILIGILIWYLFTRKDFFITKLKLKLKLGEIVHLELSAEPVKRIAFLSQPHDISGRPAKIPDIKIRVYNMENKPISNKKVTVELQTSYYSDNLQGDLEKITDSNGEVIFSGLSIKRSGCYSLLVRCDNEFEVSCGFDVLPPGLDTNFADKTFGEDQYIEALSQAISIRKGKDDIKIYEEKI